MLPVRQNKPKSKRLREVELCQKAGKMDDFRSEQMFETLKYSKVSLGQVKIFVFSSHFLPPMGRVIL